ncbi:MAG: ATP-grasp domain-containing protein [Lachnospiraceae bacterium]|nr:ATP-grasp domain-containing protein [Lachnospiraceae bacterium]
MADQYYIVPRMDSDGYLDCLLEICKKEEISLILPLQEDELLLISKNKDLFKKAGVLPVISDYEKIVLCKDKYSLNHYLTEQGISAVPTFLAKEYLESNTIENKVFVKPRYGAGSIDTFAVHSQKLLEALVEDTQEELIVQPYITGKEYGVDVYVDMLSQEVVSCFCKQKLRMRAGETEKSISIRIPEVEKLVTDAVCSIGLCGPIDVDVMEQDGKYYILEINPRFGGGYPHAYKCGVSFPDFISENGAGMPNAVTKNKYSENILAMKYSEIIVENISDI